MGDDGEHELGTREGGGPQRPADLPSQPAAGHEDEALAVLVVLVRELHRDPAAERVPDDGDPLVAQVREEVAQDAGERAQRVVGSRLVRRPVPQQVRGDDVRVPGQGGDHRVPGGAAAGDAVDEQHDGQVRVTRDAVRHAVAVQRDLGLSHGPSSLRSPGDHSSAQPPRGFAALLPGSRSAAMLPPKPDPTTTTSWSSRPGPVRLTAVPPRTP